MMCSTLLRAAKPAVAVAACATPAFAQGTAADAIGRRAFTPLMDTEDIRQAPILGR